MPEEIPSRNRAAVAVAALLAGIGVGACVKPGLGGMGLLVATTGALLVLAFRLYESRVTAQEERIASLEEHRRAIESQNDRLEALSDGIARATASLATGTPGVAVAEERTPALAGAIGHEMALHPDTLAALRTAALLHGIGRAGIAAEVWTRPGPLSREEWEQVRSHPSRGADLLRAVQLPRAVEEIVRAQQERWDGTGYPARLSGRLIPVGACILAVSAAYEAMTAGRPWRAPLSHEEAMERIREDAGAAFDPAVVTAFERVARRGEFLDLVISSSNGKRPVVTRG